MNDEPKWYLCDFCGDCVKADVAVSVKCPLVSMEYQGIAVWQTCDDWCACPACAAALKDGRKADIAAQVAGDCSELKSILESIYSAMSFEGGKI